MSCQFVLWSFKFPTLSCSWDTVCVRWLIAERRRSNCCWVFVLAVLLAVLMSFRLPPSLSVLFETWVLSQVGKVWPGFGSTPAIDSMRSSVVTANGVAIPWTHSPFTLFVGIAVFLSEFSAEFQQTVQRSPDTLQQNLPFALVNEILRN